MSKIKMMAAALCLVGFAGCAQAQGRGPTPAMVATCQNLLAINPDAKLVVVAVEGLGSDYLFTCTSTDRNRSGHALLTLGSMDEVNALIDNATTKVGSNSALPVMAYDDE